MALDPTSFKARWPEFTPTPDARVAAALADAAALCDVRVYGAAPIDLAVGLTAADLLATSPAGQQARLDPKSADGPTVYRATLNQIMRARAGGAWTVGQSPTGYNL